MSTLEQAGGIALHDDKKFLNRKQAAEYLGLSYSTLSCWASEGNSKGPTITKMGTKPLYRISDLEAWIQENRTK